MANPNILPNARLTAMQQFLAPAELVGEMCNCPPAENPHHWCNTDPRAACSRHAYTVPGDDLGCSRCRDPLQQHRELQVPIRWTPREKCLEQGSDAVCYTTAHLWLCLECHQRAGEQWEDVLENFEPLCYSDEADWVAELLELINPVNGQDQNNGFEHRHSAADRAVGEAANLLCYADERCRAAAAAVCQELGQPLPQPPPEPTAGLLSSLLTLMDAVQPQGWADEQLYACLAALRSLEGHEPWEAASFAGWHVCLRRQLRAPLQRSACQRAANELRARWPDAEGLARTVEHQPDYYGDDGPAALRRAVEEAVAQGQV